MKKHVAMALMVVVSVLGGCAKQSEPPVTEVLMSPVDVGTKTPYYEVVSPTELKLAPGVNLQTLQGAGGQNNGFVLYLDNGTVGGHMACGCFGATIGSCVTVNDVPGKVECDGGCTDSEGNEQPCGVSGPIIGPPTGEVFTLKFVPKPRWTPALSSTPQRTGFGN
jgi:hypothetical protein